MLDKEQLVLQQLNKTKRELQILYDISNAMRTTLDLEHILYIILTGVTSHAGLSFNRAILYLVNSKERCLEPKMAIGPSSGKNAQDIWNYISGSNQQLDDLIDKEKIKEFKSEPSMFDSIKDLKIPLGSHEDNLLINAYRDGDPVHISQEEIQSLKNDPLLEKFQTNELVIIPLKAKDKVNGLIIADNLYTQKSITDDDLKIFTMLANQAGLAIENSHLYEMVKHKSHTDALTSLWNHGYFQNILEKEIGSTKKNQELSLVMIDIDNFKKLNDQYGHQTGDVVLKDMANVLKESSRENDQVCRYGGEEFSIILPETSKEQAFSIAERIRQKIEEYDFFEPSSRKKLPITVSVGVASYPSDADLQDSLIALADKAMYISKMSGKNQTNTAD